MKNQKFTTFEELESEKNQTEKLITQLANAQDDALINDLWGLADEFGNKLRAAIELFVSITQRLRYLETN